MDTHRDEYTINPGTGRKIKIGTQTWKRLSAKYYMMDVKSTDQPIPESRGYLLINVLGVTIHKKANKSKHANQRRRANDFIGEPKYLIVGIKA